MLELEESRKHEQQQHKTSELLLEGLHAIILARDTDEIFNELTDILQKPLKCEAAFVLTVNGDGTLTATSSSDPVFAGTVWQPLAMFERVLAGRPVAIYDTELVPEWGSQPARIRERVRSALLFAINTTGQKALFVCVHSQRAHFSQQQVTMAHRFSAMAAQAIQRIEYSHEIADLKRAQERTKHLNLVLRAVRNINQLITHEKDKGLLIKGACDILTRDRGYTNAWAAILDSEKKAILTAESGLGANFKPMASRLERGELTVCVKKTIRNKGVFLIEDPLHECSDCPLSNLYAGRTGVSTRLEHKGKVYGLLAVSVPLEFAQNKEELSLFKEAVDDIAFALHSMEIEELRADAECALQESEKMLSEIIAGSSIATFVIDPGHLVTHWNRACENLFKIPAEKILGYNTIWKAFYSSKRPVLAEFIVDNSSIEDIHKYYIDKVKRSDVIDDAFEAEDFFPDQGESGKWFHFTAAPLRDSKDNIIGALETVQDITARKVAEEEKAKLEEQFRQSQKMEGIGRLAGGIAHDFNNMLSVIMGHAEIALEQTDRSESLHTHLTEILQAAERSADLTRQLLAFSRKQILTPEVMDLNKVISGIEKMLKRLIGEDIDFIFLPSSDLGRINADRGQMEQVIMNLAINARDAMPKGGKLTLETLNVELDEEYAAEHVDVEPGSCIMIAMTDSGCGMDEETSSMIFEPFYTTKESGKGTGLGLSTVYGIVKQSGGHVSVYSEPGKGTTLNIYIPRVESTCSEESIIEKQHTALKGSETILLIEDDDAVRRIVINMLEDSGYTILETSDGKDALRIFREDEGSISLVLSDVVMPGMNGRELVDQIEVLAPGIAVLFMSGYTDNAIQHHGVLEPGTAFIEKPFTKISLMQKIRDLLDRVKKK